MTYFTDSLPDSRKEPFSIPCTWTWKIRFFLINSVVWDYKSCLALLSSFFEIFLAGHLKHLFMFIYSNFILVYLLFYWAITIFWFYIRLFLSQELQSVITAIKAVHSDKCMSEKDCCDFEISKVTDNIMCEAE